MYKYNRIIILILDGVGCGVQHDYKNYHEMNSNTLAAVYAGNQNFSLPNLEKLGLAKILFDQDGVDSYCAGTISAKTAGNDTYSSVWEIFGITFDKRYRSETKGFDKELLYKIENKLGMPVIGNEYMAGFKIMDKYFDEHIKTHAPILYFAQDGIVLLAAHENVLRPEILNVIGGKLANLLIHENVARVITRPFIGEKGNFSRTKNRRDFVITNNPYTETALFELWRKDVDVLTTEHIYSMLGQPKHVQVINGNYDNKEWLSIIQEAIRIGHATNVMIFVLQDFDTMGHKKDAAGYGKKLLEFDAFLPEITNNLNDQDLLIITADHGCNPNLDIRGHTREMVPLIIYTKNNHKQIWLGKRDTFADIGQTIRYNFSMPSIKIGKPILEIL